MFGMSIICLVVYILCWSCRIVKGSGFYVAIGMKAMAAIEQKKLPRSITDINGFTSNLSNGDVFDVFGRTWNPSLRCFSSFFTSLTIWMASRQFLFVGRSRGASGICVKQTDPPKIKKA